MSLNPLSGQSYNTLSGIEYSELAPIPYSFCGYFLLVITVGEAVSLTEDLVIDVASYQNTLYELEIDVASDNLSPVTSLTSLSNPFLPTIAVNGNYIVANMATNPGSTNISKSGVYIHYLNAGISGIQWTDLWNFNAELDYGGGSFSVTSKEPLSAAGSTFISYTSPGVSFVTNLDGLAKSNLGASVSIFGLTASITDFGPTLNDNQAGWVSGGTFGSIALHKNLLMLTYGSQYNYLRSILTSPSLQPVNGLVQQSVITIRGAAQLIAAAAQINLQWYCQDLGITNTFNIDGLTAMGALESLAGQVGGTLRWDGDRNYIVAYPDQYFGFWEVPSASLLTPNGLSYSQHLDLETGVAGSGLIVAPFALRDTKKAIIDGVTFPPPIQTVATFTTAMTSTQPPLIVDLPFNYSKVYIQILVPPGGDTSGTNLVSLQNYITQDPDTWFDFSDSLINGVETAAGVLASETTYIHNSYSSKTYTPHVAIDYKVFPQPGNTNIDNNQFVMRVGASVKGLSNALNNNLNYLQNLYIAQLAANFEQFKFIRTYTGTFQCQFFGTIPLPGMWGRAVVPGGAILHYTDPFTGLVTQTAIPGARTGFNFNNLPSGYIIINGDMVVEGIIEKVQISYPGILTIQVAQYARVDYGRTAFSAVNTINIGQIESPF